MFKSKGQTLVEVVIAIGIAILVVGALTVAATNSIRNAQLSRNQTQGTRLAQEGIEQARALRDTLGFDAFAAQVALGNCLRFDVGAGTVTDLGAGGSEEIAHAGETVYTRCIRLAANSEDSLEVQVTVSWSDSLGDHSPGSELKSRLTRWE